MRVFVASDVPLPSPKEAKLAIETLTDYIRFCTDKVRGGSLVLFTSYTDMRAVAATLEPGWRAEADAHDNLILTRTTPRSAATASAEADPVMLEVFNNLFMNIAEQMGLRLQNTAYSVNIKERLDFSCALFDAQGHLIANAPHMPVHLGSMGESIQTVIRENAGRTQPGDVYVLNDPYHGGTHLPDVTVVTPVYLERGDAKPSFYVASRGHHADIGGITPGASPLELPNPAEVRSAFFLERREAGVINLGSGGSAVHCNARNNSGHGIRLFVGGLFVVPQVEAAVRDEPGNADAVRVTTRWLEPHAVHVGEDAFIFPAFEQHGASAA